MSTEILAATHLATILRQILPATGSPAGVTSESAPEPAGVRVSGYSDDT